MRLIGLALDLTSDERSVNAVADAESVDVAGPAASVVNLCVGEAVGRRRGGVLPRAAGAVYTRASSPEVPNHFPYQTLPNHFQGRDGGQEKAPFVENDV